MLKITLVKSVIGNTPKNRATVKALGLGKRGSSVVQEDNAVIRGMVHKVKHLLEVTEIENQPKARKAQGKRAEAAAGTAAKPAPKKRTTKKKEADSE